MFTERVASLTVHFTDEPGPGPTCILLHGFGAPGTDLVGLHEAIQAPPGTAFLFPEAPLELDLIPGGRAWWLIDMLEYQMAVMSGRWAEISAMEPEGLRAARQRIIELLGALEHDYGLDRKRLVFGGFSQGAMLACDVVLATTDPLHALVIMSGGLITRATWASRAEGRKGLRVLQTHGLADPIVPYEGGKMLERLLVDAGLNVTFEGFTGGHGVPPAALRGIERLLAEA